MSLPESWTSEKPILVYLDLANMRHGQGLDPSLLTQRMRFVHMVARRHGRIRRMVLFMDVVAFEPILEPVAEEAARLGFIIQHCPPFVGRTRKESVDRHILCELQMLLGEGIRPHQVILGSGDGDFADAATYLRNNGHFVMVFHVGHAARVLLEAADASYSLRHPAQAGAAARHAALHRFVQEHLEDLRLRIQGFGKTRHLTPAEYRLLRALIIAINYHVSQPSALTDTDLAVALHRISRTAYLETIEIPFFDLTVSNIGFINRIWTRKTPDHIALLRVEHPLVQFILEKWRPIEEAILQESPSPVEETGETPGTEDPADAEGPVMGAETSGADSTEPATDTTMSETAETAPDTTEAELGLPQEVIPLRLPSPVPLHNGALATWALDQLKERLAQARPGDRTRQPASVVSWLMGQSPPPSPSREDIRVALEDLVAQGDLTRRGSGSRTYFFLRWES